MNVDMEGLVDVEVVEEEVKEVAGAEAEYEVTISMNYLFHMILELYSLS